MKRMITSLLFCGLAAAGPISHGDKAPAAAAPPTTQPVQPRPYPDSFGVLLNRSIFASQKYIARVQQDKKPAGVDSGLALDGVVAEDAIFVALVEDTTSHKLMRVRVGDQLGRGRVSEISMHGLNYEADGGIAQVAVGQTLSGATALAKADPKPGGKQDNDRRRHAEASAR